MSDEQQWTGEERRGLPIHIINYIDTRMGEFDGKLDGLQHQVHELTMSISSWMEKQDKAHSVCRTEVIEVCEKMIDEAIPTHPENPDATASEKRKEHRKAHASWIKRVDEEMDEWKRLRAKVREWAIIGILGMIALAVWQYLLNGPKT